MKTKKKKDHNIKGITVGEVAAVQNLSPFKVLLLHLICGSGLASLFWLSANMFSIISIENPTETLRLLWLMEVPVVILVYSFFRKDKKESLYLKAVARGLLWLPVGAVVNVLGAIALGAPIGTRSPLQLLSMVHFVLIGILYLQRQSHWIY